MDNSSSDYSNPPKRLVWYTTQKRPEDRTQLGKCPEKFNPVTLHIGVKMIDLVRCPVMADIEKWLHKNVYDLSDRMKKFWIMMMCHCLDCESVNRLNTSRRINHFEMSITEPLTSYEEIKYSDPKKHCTIINPLVSYKNTHLTRPTKYPIHSYPSIFDTLINDFEKFKSSEEFALNHWSSFENFRIACVPFFLNTYTMFDHCYSDHYNDICALKALPFVNSLFLNIVLLADTYDIVTANEQTLGVDLYGYLLRILEDEDQRGNKHD